MTKYANSGFSWGSVYTKVKAIFKIFTANKEVKLLSG